jgi:archaetidylinositol phosphate synthase
MSKYVFRPLAHPVVVGLTTLGIAPTTVVLAHTCLGLFGAGLVAQGHYGLAAVLIQVKTVLDGADGQLARSTGKVTETGRFADTEGDIVVNLGLFIAIGIATDQWLVPSIAFVALTLLLSCDFNAEWLYERAVGSPEKPAVDSSAENQVVLRFLRGFYRVVFLPQDQMIRAFSRARFVSASEGSDPGQSGEVERRYNDRFTLWVLANLELATQLAVLGLCLVIGKPAWYLWFVIVGASLLVPMQLRREWLVSSMVKTQR